MADLCAVCRKELVFDEAGLSKKLYGRGSKRLLCLGCLSAETGVSVQTLCEKIEYFRKQGCLLFTPE